LSFTRAAAGGWTITRRRMKSSYTPTTPRRVVQHCGRPSYKARHAIQALSMPSIQPLMEVGFSSQGVMGFSIESRPSRLRSFLPSERINERRLGAGRHPVGHRSSFLMRQELSKPGEHGAIALSARCLLRPDHIGEGGDGNVDVADPHPFLVALKIAV